MREVLRKMKIKYAKPQILFESFELSTSIATTCAFIQTNTFNYERDCVVYPADDESFRLWEFGVTTGCDFTPGEGIYDALCYQVPNDAMNVHDS